MLVDRPADDPAGSLHGARVIAAGATLDGVSRTIARIVLERPSGWLWHGALLASVLLTIAAFVLQGGWSPKGYPDPAQAALAVQAMDVVCYDAWIGIACGTLLVSTMLKLAEVEWRCAVTRIAEMLALLAALAALGLSILRPGWLWVIETDLTALWPVSMPADPRAILVSDATGLVILLLVAVIVWAVSLLPDLAALRDLAHDRDLGANSQKRRTIRVRIYGWISTTWLGSARQWQGWLALTQMIALLAMILCAAIQAAAAVRVAALTPSGSGSLLPVALLVGAVLSGTGLLAAFVAALRAIYRLQMLVTERHLDILARMLLVLGLVSLYTEVTELGATLLNGDEAERANLAMRLWGDSAPLFWMHAAFGLGAVQLFWLPSARRSGLVIGLVGSLTVIGTLADRMSLNLIQHAPLDEAARGAAVLQGFAGFLSGLGILLIAFLLCLRLLPMLSIVEMRWLAMLRNPDAIAAPEPSKTVVFGQFSHAPPIPAGIVQASFASDHALAGAVRILAERRSSTLFAAFGPVPMPETSAVLRLPESAIRDAALIGALIGGIGFFAGCQWGMAGDAVPSGARSALAWPFLVLPSFAFAAMTGTFAALLPFLFDALLRTEKLPQAGPGFAPAACDRFILTAVPPVEDGDAGWIERRLAGVPDAALRPLAVRLQRQDVVFETRP